MAAIHGKSHQALRHLRDKPAALAVLWIYISRSNYENVAWPSLRGLEQDTGWNRTTCQDARAFLVDHKALEKVEDYIRPQWRSLDPLALAKKRGLYHRTEYFRATGVFEMNGEHYELLYFGGSELSDIEDDEDHVLRHRTPTAQDTYAVGHLRGRTELDSSTELDSRSTELTTTTVGVADVAKAYEQNFGALTPMLKDGLAAAVEEYSAEWCLDAMRAAVAQEKRFWRYVEGILKRWKREGRASAKPTPTSNGAAYDAGDIVRIDTSNWPDEPLREDEL